MTVKIRDIGNSKGIIIPKNILTQCNIIEDVIVAVKNNHIEITPVPANPREGWAEAFKKMAQNGDDILVAPDVFQDENLEDWTW